jgi:prolyl 4-hydroxylase
MMTHERFFIQMTDVELGGATVFPALRTALWPKKGAAAFWFNLKRSGQGDYKTRHAGEYNISESITNTK